MKSRKALDLNSKVSLEAVITEDVIELYFRVGKKEYRIAGNEIKELSNWLSSEILNNYVKPVSATEMLKLNSQVIQAEPRGPIAEGPLNPNDPKAKQQGAGTALDNRRAISGDQARVIGNVAITKADDLRVHNLSGQIDKAKQVFSKESLSTFDPA